MNTIDTIKSRKSVRAFLDKEPSSELIKEILDSARYSPSGVNMQPWNLYILKGKKKKELESKIIDSFESDKKEKMDYNYYPSKFEEPYKTRRKETGLLMYKTLNISREDKDKQIEQWKANYRAFDAPVVIYFFIDSSLEKGSYLDYGMFLQSLVLSATSLGLATCIQASLAEYPSVVKEYLKVDNNQKLLCGISLGYEDKEALINSYRTPRIDIEEFATFIE